MKNMQKDYNLLEERNGQEGYENKINGKFYQFPSYETMRKLLRENKELFERKSDQGFTRLIIAPIEKIGTKQPDTTEEDGAYDGLIGAWRAALKKHFDEGEFYYTRKDNEKPESPDDPLTPITDINDQGPLWVWDNYSDADTNGDLVYHPTSLTPANDLSHGGITKEELLEQSESTLTPGYTVFVLEDMPNIPRAGEAKTKGKPGNERTQIDTSGSALAQYRDPAQSTPSPEEYVKALHEESKKADSPYYEESHLTPEESILYALHHLHEHNQVIDDWERSRGAHGSFAYHLGAYFWKTADVPGSDWNRVFRQANADRDDRRSRDGSGGARPTVRMG